MGINQKKRSNCDFVWFKRNRSIFFVLNPTKSRVIAEKRLKKLMKFPKPRKIPLASRDNFTTIGMFLSTCFNRCEIYVLSDLNCLKIL